MLTTMLEPYEWENKNIVPYDGQYALRGQGVSYYVGYDVGPTKTLTHPLLGGMGYVVPFKGDKPLTKWCPNDHLGRAAHFLYRALDSLNRAAKQVYVAHKILKETDGKKCQPGQNISDFHRDVVQARWNNALEHSSGVREIIGNLHLLFSLLLFRANRIKGGSIGWPRIGDFRRFYELLDGGDKEAEELRDIIFQKDDDGLMKKLAVESVVMHDLLDSVNIYTDKLMFVGNVPTMVLVGPPKDNEYDFLVRNHAVSQIMAGVDIVISRLGIFDAEYNEQWEMHLQRQGRN